MAVSAASRTPDTPDKGVTTTTAIASVPRRTRSTSFYYAFLALPVPKRRALIAVFDVCRAVDDSVDLAPDARRARAAADAWRAEIDRLFTGGAPETIEGAQLKPYIAPFRLPHEQFVALVDGVAMDATPGRFATFAELEPYCHRVASSVGLICAEIFGYESGGTRDYARELGVALQLTNILRDVAVDFSRGRLYIPLDEMARFGCVEDDIAAQVNGAGRGVRSAPLRALLEFQASRARARFLDAAALLPPVDRERFLPAEIMRGIYRELLRRIERHQYDVFSGVIRVPKPRQVWIAIDTWLRTARGARA